MENLKLSKIAAKYGQLEHNDNNYSIGGGLAGDAFASNRHQDAKYDEGKLTEGKATQLFMKATGLSIEVVKEVINYAVPNMEWHHAGKLPKSYGGGMKKTYFINSHEIVNIATNWDSLVEKLEISKNEKRIAAEKKQSSEKIKQEFLTANAKKITRVEKIENWALFYETDKEMNGKYGWFSSYGKSYNMTEYYSGWQFESEEKFNEFRNL